jgi:hypothetical protein
MERITIRVPKTIAAALYELACREDRDLQRQAERFIREGLIREGALPDLKQAAHPETAEPIPA